MDFQTWEVIPDDLRIGRKKGRAVFHLACPHCGKRFGQRRLGNFHRCKNCKLHIRFIPVRID